MYDFEITTPPVPAGTYEVRFDYQPTAHRGVAQLSWDGVPLDMPVNLSLYSTSSEIGYVTSGSDPSDPYGYENDKTMHDNGYLKGPASYKVVDLMWYSGESARYCPNILRRIIGIYTFTEAGV